MLKDFKTIFIFPGYILKLNTTKLAYISVKNMIKVIKKDKSVLIFI